MRIIDNLYPLIRPLLFKLDPEVAHSLVIKAGGFVKVGNPLFWLLSQGRRSDNPRQLAGLRFPNLIGIAAGCDKNCEAVELFAALGVGHIEIGTVTALPQSGNPRPRIFRFPSECALINRMGFPSAGAAIVAQNLKVVSARLTKLGEFKPIIGINIGKNKEVALEDAPASYLAALKPFRGLYDYCAVNVSSPNTPELRALQEPARLSRLLIALKAECSAPLFVKLSPDLSNTELKEIVEVVVAVGISGIIATNTTVNRDSFSSSTNESGGLSGKPLHKRACSIISQLRQLAPQGFPIIGAGGITDHMSASEILSAGADLLQCYSGLVFRGPSLLTELKKL
jgi:dihydroorotate dehydrogenase